MALWRTRPPRGLAVAAALMVAFGLAEILTAFNVGWFAHTFGIPRSPVFTYLGAAVGVLYVLSGALILTMRRWAAALAIACLGAAIVGRVLLVATGAYPVGSLLPGVSVAIGTGVVALFAVYVAWAWRFVGRPPATRRG
jgi:hypothetical protein